MLQSTGPRPLILRQQHLSLTPGRVSRTMTGPRTLPVLAAVAPAHNSGNGAAVQQATVVPFTLQDLDAMSAKYNNMDERLDIMERHILELTRELKTGTSSITGTVTAAASATHQTVITSGMTTVLTPGGLPVVTAAATASVDEPTKAIDELAARTSTHPDGEAAHLAGSANGAAATPAPAAPGEPAIVVAGAAAGSATTAADGMAGDPEEKSDRAVALGKQAVRLVSDQVSKVTQRLVTGQPTTEPVHFLDSADASTGPAVTTAATQASTQGAHQNAQQAQTQGGIKGSKGASGKVQQQQAAGVQAVSEQAMIPRDRVYEFNKLEAGLVELINSGYIESVKQLRETLMIQEWDMANKHLAKRKAIAHFERYVVDHKLVEEAGGFEALGRLYDDPDALSEILPSDKLKMVARAMIEESMSERRAMLYHTCGQMAQQMATLTTPAAPGPTLASTLLRPMGQSLWGKVKGAWGLVKGVLPF